jgi:hypothetical protein
MRPIKVLIPSAILAGGFLFCISTTYATPEYGKKEKKSCTYCHMKVVKDKADMARNLKAAGACYKENDHSLAKCSPSK